MIDFVFDDKGYFRDASLWLEFCVAAKRDSALKRIMAEIYDAWREPVRQLIDKGVESGEFAPRLNIDDIVDLFAMAMDGSETATAVDAAGLNAEKSGVGAIGPERYRLTAAASHLWSMAPQDPRS